MADRAVPSTQDWALPHCRVGQYLEWTKNTDTATCGWCQHKTQTWEHLLEHCKR